MSNSGIAAGLLLAIVVPVFAWAQTAPSAPAQPRPAAAAVDYASGKLTVVSDGAPLAFILKLVAEKTGAFVDLAPELQSEPVVARLGPAPVREVLTGLLDSPRIDYIVMGTGDEPGSLKRIVVRTRRSFGQLGMASILPAQAKQSGPEEEEKLEPGGRLLSNAPADGAPSQPKLMDHWKRARVETVQTEIKQQPEDRQNEKNQRPGLPVPQNTPPAENPRPNTPPPLP